MQAFSWRKYSLIGLVFWTGLLNYGFSQTSQPVVSLKLIEEKAKKYKGPIKLRFLALKKLIIANQSKPIAEQLKAVNNFYNLFEYQNEGNYQGTGDYWKTPEEFVVDGGGDCEDFAIAKYFTLLAVGVPLSTLRITYAKSLKLNQAHMVLTYYPTPAAEPLILDSLESKILQASKRPDLIPIYNFNGEGLWLAKQRGAGAPIGDSDHLSKWSTLIQRMKKEEGE